MWQSVHPSKVLSSGSSCRDSVETNLTSIHEDTGLIPGLAQWIKDPPLPRAVVSRCDSDLALLWLWRRPSQQPQLRLDTYICRGCSHKKTKKKKVLSSFGVCTYHPLMHRLLIWGIYGSQRMDGGSLLFTCTNSDWNLVFYSVMIAVNTMVYQQYLWLCH